MHEIKYYKFIIFIIIISIVLIIVSLFTYTSKQISFYGIYNDKNIHIKFNTKLSDKIKNNEYLKFNNIKTKYSILEFGDYEIIDNEIYQNIILTVDNDFINNEVGLIELSYDNEKTINYILDLFK